MKIGIVVNSFTWPDAPASIPHRLAAIATGAERASVDSFWVMDHISIRSDSSPASRITNGSRCSNRWQRSRGWPPGRSGSRSERK